MDRNVAPVMRGNRLMVLLGVQSIAVAAMALALYQMVPLKTVEPYLMRVTETGRTESSNQFLEKYSVNDAQKAYFLSRWVESFMDVDDRLEERLKHAMRFTRGNASKKLAEWVKENNLLSRSLENPSLEIHTQIVAVNAIGSDQVLIRFYTVTRGLPNSTGPQRDNWSITAKYIQVKPSTAEEADFNPVGMYVVDFSLTKELTQ